MNVSRPLFRSLARQYAAIGDGAHPNNGTETRSGRVYKFDGAAAASRNRKRVAEKPFQLFIKDLCGFSLAIDGLTSTTTVDELKMLISDKNGIGREAQRLIYGPRILADGDTLAEYELVGGCTLHLVLRMRGC